MQSPIGLDLIHSFLIVAQELNFRRSAERLHLDQSALTRRIQKLEAALGFKLLERTTREVALTPAGRSFHDDNARLLAQYDDSVESARRIAQGRTGLLRIAYMAFAATELMPAAVARFRQRHPHVDTRLHYMPTQGQKMALANDEIDIGYLIGPFEHSDVQTVTLAADPLFVVTPRNHDLLRKQRIEPADLADQDLILGDIREWGEFRWRLNDMFSAEGIAPRVRIEASNTLALIGLVAAGLGVTVYPESLIGFLGRNVEVRHLHHPAFRIHTVLAWKRANRTTQVGAFVDIARQLTARG